MTREELCIKKGEALASFQIKGEVLSCELYGNGHINDTFLVVCDVNGNLRRYILQRMNHEIFTKPVELMENIQKVTAFLEKEIEKLEQKKKEIETIMLDEKVYSDYLKMNELQNILNELDQELEEKLLEWEELCS